MSHQNADNQKPVAPIVECDKCKQPMRVQYQQAFTPAHEPLWIVDCQNKACRDFAMTFSLPINHKA